MELYIYISKNLQLTFYLVWPWPPRQPGDYGERNERNDEIYNDIENWAPREEVTRAKEQAAKLVVPEDKDRKDRTPQQMAEEAELYRSLLPRPMSEAAIHRHDGHDSNNDNDNNKMPSSSTPRPSHPTARAFFDALDNVHSRDQKQQYRARRQSDFIKKKLTTLGWRNRHSQDKDYPITVLDTTFSVQQIQRGEVEETYGTGACVWPAAIVLIKYLEQNAATIVAGKKILDLGAGTGGY